MGFWKADRNLEFEHARERLTLFGPRLAEWPDNPSPTQDREPAERSTRSAPRAYAQLSS